MSKVVSSVLKVASFAVQFIPGIGQLVGAALMIGLNVGAALLAPKAKQQARQASATSLQLGEVSRQALVGIAATAGSLANAFNYGGKYGTDWEVLSIALADHECDALVGFYVNDVYVPFTGDGMVPGYNNQLAVYWRPGTENQSVPAILTSQGGYAATDNGAGVCHVTVCYKADDSDAKKPIWPGGRPRFLWIVRGLKCYDPREDSTVPGGSGTHRWSNPATREFSENPIVARYNWARGIYACNRVDDPDMLLIGRGLTVNEAPPINVAPRANVCDELVSASGGGSEHRYRCGGILPADEQYQTIEEYFAAACGGVITQPQGCVEVEPGQAKSPSFVFTDGDLIAGSQVRWDDFLSEANDEWVNTVIPRYVEPTQRWGDHAAPIRRVISDVIADGGPREQTLSLPIVTRASQAGRVGEIIRRLGRLQGRGAVTLGPRFCEIEEGDWGIWVSDRRFGGEGRTVRVEAWSSGANGHMTLQLRQISASCYSDGDAFDDGSVSVPQAPPPDIGPPAEASWALEPGLIDPEGAQVPAIVFTGLVDDNFARFIRLEYWLDDGSHDPDNADWASVGVFGPDLTRREIGGLKGAAQYYGAVSYVVDNQPGERLILGPVTTPPGKLAGVENGATDGATLPTTGPGNIRDENGSPWKPGELGNGGLTLIPDGRGFRLGYAPDIAVPRIDMPTIEVPGVDLPEFGSPAGNVTMRVMREVRPLDMGAANQSAMTQAEDGLEQIAAAILGAQAELVRTRGVLRDAGIVVDPASGRVIIHALDRADERLNQVFVTLDAVNASLVLKAGTAYVNNAIATAVLDPSQVPIFAGIEAQISEAQIDISALQAAVLLKASAVELDGAKARITTAESEIDALNGQIVDKVETSDFSALEGRVTTVETIAFAIGDAAGIADTVRVTRLLFKEAETEAQNTLGALLAGDRDRRGTVSAIAEARREITAKIVEDVSAEAAARVALGVRVGAAEAGLVSEQTVRAAQDLALAQAITGLSASLGADVTALEATLTAEQIARVEGDEALAGDIVQLSSGVGRDSELQAAAALSALVEGDRAKRSASAAIAAARQELGTRVTDGQAAEAMARLALLARIQQAEASILQEQGVRATADEAIAFAISELTAGIADEVSDRAAAVSAEAQARVDGDGALAARADTLEASIADETTARAASVAGEAQARVDGDVALAARADALEASIADEATARSAAVTAEAGARVDGDAAVAASVDALETSFSSDLADVAASVTAEAGARTTADEALAARADTIEASIASEVSNRTAAVSNEAQARVDGDAAEATARQALSVTLDNTAVALAAAVENEEIARVQGDGALAADIDAVSTTVNGHTATITQYGESIDGLEARAGVILDVNGRATGWRTAAGEETDYFDIISDLVRVIDPDTGEILMGLVGGLMRLRGIEVDTVKANVIDTVQIKLGGVNGTTIVTKPTTQINSSTPDILTYTLPSIPNGVVSVSLRFAGTVECLQDGLDDYNWLLKKSGTLVTGAFHNNIGRAGGFLAFVEAEYTELIPVAGTVYTVDYRSRTGQNIILSNGVLVSEFRYR